MRISDMCPGSAFRIIRIDLPDEIGRRLSDMGFTEGSEGILVRRTLFGGPIQLRIRGYDILIRRSEASGMEAELLCAPIHRHGRMRRRGGHRG